jgi:lipoic acid synthetase
MWECFSQKTATFLILGSRCTRDCRFCSVKPGPSEPLDPGEPVRVADVAHQMGLKYVVVTSVTRDDVSDGGASLFAQTIREIRKRMADACVEVLIPDFQGNKDALKTVLKARPDVLNHNIETVPRLYPRVRPQAEYQRSLDILQWAYEHDPALPTKSGLMLGTPRSAGSRLSHPDPGPILATVKKPFAGRAIYPTGRIRRVAQKGH